MLSNSSETPVAAPPPNPDEARKAKPAVAGPDPRAIIEVASSGSGGGPNDTSGGPPGIGDPGDPSAGF